MAHKEEQSNVCRNLGGKPERKRLLGRSRYRKEDNIEMDLKGIRQGSWTGFFWLRTWQNGGLFCVW
jgi:hypothetical protein